MGMEEGVVSEKVINEEVKVEVNQESSFQKVLTEKKNAMEAKRLLEEENRRLKEERMREKEDLKGLLELREKEIQELKIKDTRREKLIEDGIKASTLKKELSKIGLDERYYDHAMRLVDMNGLHYDNESRVVTGAEVQAKLLYEKVPVFFGKTNVGVNNAAPVGGGGSLTLEEWSKLPIAEKQKRRNELRKTIGV